MKLSIKKQVAELNNQLELLKTYHEALVDKFDTRSENWQESEKGEEWQEKTDELEHSLDELESAINQIEELMD